MQAIQKSSRYDGLIEAFTRWADRRPDIRAALILGSQARSERPADAWSDLDIVLVARHPERYTAEAGWLVEVGDPRLTFVERMPAGGEMERRVLFAGGLDVDFALFPAHRLRLLMCLLRLRQRLPVFYRLLPGRIRRIVAKSTQEFSGVLARGYRMLLDKDGLADKIQALLPIGQKHQSQPPISRDFLTAIHTFWYDAVWTAKHLCRHELWWAKCCLDMKMKLHDLLPMLEWHARATRGWDWDTWHRGRFLEQWADRRAVQALGSCYARYDIDDCWRALRGTMDLFRWTARETADRLGFEYPAATEEEAVSIVESLMPGETMAVI